MQKFFKNKELIEYNLKNNSLVNKNTGFIYELSKLSSNTPCDLCISSDNNTFAFCYNDKIRGYYFEFFDSTDLNNITRLEVDNPKLEVNIMQGYGEKFDEEDHPKGTWIDKNKFKIYNNVVTYFPELGKSYDELSKEILGDADNKTGIYSDIDLNSIENKIDEFYKFLDGKYEEYRVVEYTIYKRNANKMEFVENVTKDAHWFFGVDK